MLVVVPWLPLHLASHFNNNSFRNAITITNVIVNRLRMEGLFLGLFLFFCFFLFGPFPVVCLGNTKFLTFCTAACRIRRSEKEARARKQGRRKGRREREGRKEGRRKEGGRKERRKKRKQGRKQERKQKRRKGRKQRRYEGRHSSSLPNPYCEHCVYKWGGGCAPQAPVFLFF